MAIALIQGAPVCLVRGSEQRKGRSLLIYRHNHPQSSWARAAELGVVDWESPVYTTPVPKLNSSPIWDSFATSMTVGVLPRRRRE
jgi:hypothetical protein